MYLRHDQHLLCGPCGASSTACCPLQKVGLGLRFLGLGFRVYGCRGLVVRVGGVGWGGGGHCKMFRRSAVCGGELYSECRVWLNQIGSCSSFFRSAIRKRSSSVPRLLRGFTFPIRRRVQVSNSLVLGISASVNPEQAFEPKQLRPSPRPSNVVPFLVVLKKGPDPKNMTHQKKELHRGSR